MNVVDSSCWIEFAEDSPVKKWIAPIIENLDDLLVPTIVLYEVYKKLSATKGAAYADKFAKGMLNAEIIPLDPELSLIAANISQKYKLPMADSIIYATTKQHNAVLWTTDQHFDGLPNVRYFESVASKWLFLPCSCLV